MRSTGPWMNSPARSAAMKRMRLQPGNSVSRWRLDGKKRFFAAPTPKTRKVALRSAMTMSPDRGGIFDTLLRLVRFGLGGAAGSGEQFVSWIHEEDFARAVEFLAAHDEIDGAVDLACAGAASESRVHAYAARGLGREDRAACRQNGCSRLERFCCARRRNLF